jgi:hypothetical protein
VVAYPIGNAGSSMLLSVLQEQMSQLVGRWYDCTTCSPKSDVKKLLAVEWCGLLGDHTWYSGSWLSHPA